MESSRSALIVNKRAPRLEYDRRRRAAFAQPANGRATVVPAGCAPSSNRSRAPSPTPSRSSAVPSPGREFQLDSYSGDLRPGNAA